MDGWIKGESDSTEFLFSNLLEVHTHGPDIAAYFRKACSRDKASTI